MANVLGTKLRCESCGGQLVVTGAGDGTVECHGVPMVVVSGAPQADGAERASGATSDGADQEYY